ncbi:Tannase/feruloyl esterase [Aspergillus cavernicola]|uniref:Carboxylic ester hydrolase n=1 Tax=Aspergillus cavernicola TaxID=176166 RepID=A0ABR4IS23_9EURO
MALTPSLLWSAFPGLALQCSNFTPPILPDAQVLSITSHPVYNLTLPLAIPGLPTNLPPLTFCNVTVTLTHGTANDTVFVTVALPPRERWNGRYQATGGGGLAAGYDHSLVVPVLSGFAASFTDGGLTLNHTIDPQSGEWGMNNDGTLNRDLMLNLAWRSIHDMALASKHVIHEFYGKPANYSYWNGCSQGGRQGYAAAAKYPTDFDGILAMAPGLSMEYIGPADFWPVVVMANEGQLVPPCVFDAFQRAIVETCDPLDGAVDELLSDYDLLLSCHFDPQTLVGTKVGCEDTETMITATQARIVGKILDGPRTPEGNKLWYGLAPGATFSGIAGTRSINKALVPVPFVPALGWLKYMVLRDANYDFTKMSYAEYFEAFNTSVTIGASFLGADPLNISAFHSAGGKLLSWVGLADEYIPPSSLLNYHDQIATSLGSYSATHEFYRVFTAPGVGHCQGGNGPQPLNAMTALVDWVEHGRAPETLPAGTNSANGKVISRDLCLYPKKPVYLEGRADEEGSFACEEAPTELEPSVDRCAMIIMM